MQVRDIMVSDPVLVDRGLAIEDARIFDEKCGFHHLPVVDGGRLVGIVSDRDLIEAEFASESVCVGEIMSTDVVSVGPDDDALDALQAMLQNKISCLPVIEGDEVLGVVTSTDLLGAYLRRCESRGDDHDLNPPVTERMTRSLIVVQPSTHVAEAWAMCAGADVRHLIVTAEQMILVGIVSDRDLRRGLAQGAETISEIMHTEVVTLAGSVHLATAVRAMLEAGISSLPITESGELMGILTTTDILDHCLTTRDAFEAWRPD